MNGYLDKLRGMRQGAVKSAGAFVAASFLALAPVMAAEAAEPVQISGPAAKRLKAIEGFRHCLVLAEHGNEQEKAMAMEVLEKLAEVSGKVARFADNYRLFNKEDSQTRAALTSMFSDMEKQKDAKALARFVDSNYRQVLTLLDRPGPAPK